MITIADRQYNKICQISFDGTGDLVAYDDKFSQPEDSDLSSYFFSVYKTSKEIEKIQVGSIVYVQDNTDIRVFEIMRIESDNDSIEVYCIDGGLDFINEEKLPFHADKSYPITYYVDDVRFDSGWEIGVNQIASTVTRKLSYDSTESAIARLRKIANAFDAEIIYSFDLSDSKIIKRLINIYPKGSRAKRVRLEYGYEVGSIKKTESIENLATALVALGDNVTLDGFQVPDKDRADWYIVGATLINLPATKLWSRHSQEQSYSNTGEGAIVGLYESTAKTKETLYQVTKQQVLKRCFPEVTYEVDVVNMPERVRRGDLVDVVDHDFMPAITIRGRVASIDNVSFIDNTVGTITITNIEEVRSTVEANIENLRKQLKYQVSNWQNVPYILTISSTSGNVFKDGNISTTLVAKVTKNSIDVTNQFTKFIWTRTSAYDKSKDTQWNANHTASVSRLEITNHDVDAQATFTCTVYQNDTVIATESIVIKDFVVSKHKGDTPPENAGSGDFWLDTSVEPDELKIYKDNHWIPVVKSNDELVTFKEEVNSWITQYVDLLKKESDTQHSDLSGQFADLKKDYGALKEKAAQIDGLNERTTAVEINAGNSQVLIETLSKYFTFSDDGFLIGAKGEKFQMVMNGERLSFMDGGREVAYISNQQLYILSGVFLSALVVGNHKFEKFETEWTFISYVGGGV